MFENHWPKRMWSKREKLACGLNYSSLRQIPSTHKTIQSGGGEQRAASFGRAVGLVPEPCLTRFTCRVPYKTQPKAYMSALGLDIQVTDYHSYAHSLKKTCDSPLTNAKRVELAPPGSREKYD